MKKTIYNKLVRDRIPQIIEESGKRAVTEILEDVGYAEQLNRKLSEELTEFLDSGSVEELADMGEVMYAILALRGIAVEEFQQIRMEKQEARGGFDKRIFLREVVEE